MNYFYKLKYGDNKIRILPPVKSHFARPFIKNSFNLVDCTGPGCIYCRMGFEVDLFYNEKCPQSAWREGAD